MFMKIDLNTIKEIVGHFDVIYSDFTRKFPKDEALNKRLKRTIEGSCLEHLRGLLKNEEITLSLDFFEFLMEEVNKRTAICVDALFESSEDGLFELEQAFTWIHNVDFFLNQCQLTLAGPRAEAESLAEVEKTICSEKYKTLKAQWVYDLAYQAYMAIQNEQWEELQTYETAIENLLNACRIPYVGIATAEVIHMLRENMKAGSPALEEKLEETLDARTTPPALIRSTEKEYTRLMPDVSNEKYYDFDACRRDSFSRSERTLSMASSVPYDFMSPVRSVDSTPKGTPKRTPSKPKPAVHSIDTVTALYRKESDFTMTVINPLIGITNSADLLNVMNPQFYQTAIQRKTTVRCFDGHRRGLQDALELIGQTDCVRSYFDKNQRESMKDTLAQGIQAVLDEYRRHHCIWFKSHYRALRNAVQNPHANTGTLMTAAIKVLMSDGGKWRPDSIKTLLVRHLNMPIAVAQQNVTREELSRAIKAYVTTQIPMDHVATQNCAADLWLPLISAWNSTKKCALVVDAMVSNSTDAVQTAFDSRRWGTKAKSGEVFRKARIAHTLVMPSEIEPADDNQKGNDTFVDIDFERIPTPHAA